MSSEHLDREYAPRIHRQHTIVISLASSVRSCGVKVYEVSYLSSAVRLDTILLQSYVCSRFDHCADKASAAGTC